MADYAPLIRPTICRTRRANHSVYRNMAALMSSPRRKNISLPFFGKACLTVSVPPSPEGRFAIVTSVGGGMRWPCRRARRARRCGRRNRVVPIPRRWDQVSRDEREATVARKPAAPRRARISRNTIAQGVPVVPAALWFLACAKCTRSLHARLAGAASIRHSLRPLDREGRGRCTTRADSCRGSAKLCPRPALSSPGLTGGPSIPEAAVLEPKSRGVLDRPVEPGDDTERG